MEKIIKKIKLNFGLIHFCLALFKFSPVSTLRVFVWTFLNNALEGVGLLLLFPLLSLSNLHLGVNLPLVSGILGWAFQLLKPLQGEISLSWILLIYVGLIGLLSSLAYTRSIEATKLRLSFCQSIQNKCHEALLSASLIFHASKKLSGHAQILTTEVMRLSAAIYQWVQLVSSLGLVFVYVVFALLVSWKMSLLVVGCALVTLLVLSSLGRSVFQWGQRFQSQSQDLYHQVLTHLEGLKEAKSFCVEPVFQKDFERINQSLFNNQMAVAKSNALTSGVYQFLAAVSLAVIIAVAYVELKEPWVNLLLLVMLFVRIIPRASQAHTLYHGVMNLYPSYLAIEKICKEAFFYREKIYKTNIDKKNNKFCLLDLLGLSDPDNLVQIKLKNIGFSYGDREIFKKLNLEINFNPGEVILISGVSGEGKSTLCDLLAGLCFINEGQIFINDQGVTAVDWIQWRAFVSYFSQRPFLIAGSIRENLTLGEAGRYTDRGLIEALQRAGAWSFVEKLDGCLDAKVSDFGGSLSGGQRQRLALARVFLRKPRLLILDEVCAHLDQAHISWILEQIRQLRLSDPKLSILIVSHTQEHWHGVTDRCFELKSGALWLEENLNQNQNQNQNQVQNNYLTQNYKIKNIESSCDVFL